MAKSILFVVLLGSAFLGLSPACFEAAEEHLGKVNFPNSCSAEAQPLIEKGVALLHSFQYQEAQQTFEEVGTRDAKCATAHWGKAMTFYYQLWEFPDEKKMKEGRK